MPESARANGPKGHATASEIHPLLRQRMLNRAATLSEGVQPARSWDHLRRRSSLWSDVSSDSRPLSRADTASKSASTEMAGEEATLWYSAPLVFAILPAVGGIFFQGGNGFVTDVLLVLLGGIFLNWCVKTPWDWYYAAQQVEYVEAEEDLLGETFVEDDQDDLDVSSEDTAAEPSSNGTRSEARPPLRTQAQLDAERQLNREAKYALTACFFGPLLGAGLLHAIRDQLTRDAEGLVSNFHLTIFIMAAELRLVKHLITRKEARVKRLQRIAAAEVRNQLSKADVEQLAQRLAEIEARLAEPVAKNEIDTARLSATIHQTVQPQVDALNRAMRRYEKKLVAQVMQTDARMLDFEARLRDVLSLAAAGQRPGVITMGSTFVLQVTSYAVRTAWGVVTYPYRMVVGITSGARSRFVGEQRPPPRRRVKRMA